ncbi:MAG: hypothetical protein JW990_11925 [Thermoleophilia bacterium]|nr:hypothetical protein [Thermoleophilia bacterium]
MRVHRAGLCCFVVVGALLAGGVMLLVTANGAALGSIPPPEPSTSAELLPLVETTLQPSDHPVLSDVRVRRAIAYCTDKDALIAAAYPELTPTEREALVSDSFISEDSIYYAEPATLYPYAPATGKALLEAAGWALPAGEDIRVKDGKSLLLTLKTTDSALRIAFLTVFEAQMQACGIDVIRLHLPALTGIFWRDFEASEFAWNFADVDDPGGDWFYACENIPSPDNDWTGGNVMGWCNTQASEAISFASDTTLTPDQRRAYYETFIDLFAEDVPVLPLFWRPDSTTWEHIGFNLETYLQQVDATPAIGAVLLFSHYNDAHGTVAVPPGAVTQTTGIGFYPLVESEHPAPEGFVHFVYDAFRLSAFLEGVPQDTHTFAKPITVTLNYFWPGVPGWQARYDETSLVLFVWDGDAWQDAYLTCPEGSRYKDHSLAADQYVVRVCHTGEFSLMGEPTERVYLPFVARDYVPGRLFFDDFSDPSSGWFVGDEGGVSFSYQEGEYEADVHQAHTGVSAESPLSSLSGEFALEADMRLSAGTNIEYGIGWGGLWGFYTFRVCPGTQDYRLLLCSGGCATLADGSSLAISPAGGSNLLRMEHVNDSIDVYVNGQLLGSAAAVADASFGGHAWVEVQSIDAPATARFDNFTVWRLP